jgi:hypothetical protein
VTPCGGAEPPKRAGRQRPFAGAAQVPMRCGKLTNLRFLGRHVAAASASLIGSAICQTEIFFVGFV